MFNILNTTRKAAIALVALAGISATANAQDGAFAALGGADAEIMTETAMDDTAGKFWNQGLPAGMPDFTHLNSVGGQLNMLGHTQAQQFGMANQVIGNIMFQNQFNAARTGRVTTNWGPSPWQFQQSLQGSTNAGWNYVNTWNGILTRPGGMGHFNNGFLTHFGG